MLSDASLCRPLPLPVCRRSLLAVLVLGASSLLKRTLGALLCLFASVFSERHHPFLAFSGPFPRVTDLHRSVTPWDCLFRRSQLYIVRHLAATAFRGSFQNRNRRLYLCHSNKRFIPQKDFQGQSCENGTSHVKVLCNVSRSLTCTVVPKPFSLSSISCRRQY